MSFVINFFVQLQGFQALASHTVRKSPVTGVTELIGGSARRGLAPKISGPQFPAIFCCDHEKLVYVAGTTKRLTDPRNANRKNGCLAEWINKEEGKE